MMKFDFRFILWSRFNFDIFKNITSQALKELNITEEVLFTTYKSESANSIAVMKTPKSIDNPEYPEHIKSKFGYFVCFSKDHKIYSPRTFAYIVAHELIHIRQHIERRIHNIQYIQSFGNDYVEYVRKFDGKLYIFPSDDYHKFYPLLPWEKEANDFAFKFCEQFIIQGDYTEFDDVICRNASNYAINENRFDPNQYLIMNKKLLEKFEERFNEDEHIYD